MSIESFAQDVRYAARALAASPGFTAVAVLCLALGIGTNSTLFSCADAILLRPFPFADPERLVVLNEKKLKAGINEAAFSYRTLNDWRDQNTVFSGIAGVTFRSLTLANGGDPVRLEGAGVSWDLFPMLGVRPALGRPFRADEDRPGAPGAVILSDGVWRAHFHADPGAIGRSVLVNAAPHSVVAIMPPGFQFPERQEMWVPLSSVVSATPDVRTLIGFARLREGVTLDRARTEMDAVGRRLDAGRLVEDQGFTPLVRELRDEFIPDDVKLITLTMMGAVTLVLMIACANVANLLLARATARHREISIRAALGAGRVRLARQLLTESVLLSLLAVPLGIALAYWGLGLLDGAIPPEDQIPYYIDWRIDRRVLGYTILVSVLTGLVFGLAPAIQAVGGNLHESLKEGGRGGGASAHRNRMRNALVVAEVALSLVLLVGASLFVRSFLKLQVASGGFDTAPLMTMRFFMPGDAYAPEGAIQRRVEDVIRRVEAIPGVEAAFASNLIPLGGGGGGDRVIVEGRTVTRGEEPIVYYAGVTPHMLRTLGVSLLAGRDFTDAEGATRSRVAVVNQALGRKLWPDENPLGRRFRLAGLPADEWFTVIGVARDFFVGDLEDTRPDPAAFVPYPYMATRNTGLTIRVAGEPAHVTSAVRERIHASDVVLPVFSVQTMEQVRRLGFWQFGLFGAMFSIFGGIALALAAIGVYGVLSYAVSQRTQEIGVRVALGAARGDVMRLVIGQGLRLAALGIACGLVGAFGVTRVVSTLLYNVSPTDPISFAGVAVFLTAMAVVASYVPARRAVGVDPIVALRAE